MRKLNHAIDRFCILHPNFGVRNLMLYIVVSNVAVYLLDSFSRGTLSNLLSFSLAALLRGQVWRLVTFILVPDAGGAISLLISCYFYYWIGTSLERQWGTAKFSCYYFGGAILTLLGAVLVSLLTGISFPLSGTYYVNFAMFLAFAALWPEAQVLLFFIIPIRIKYLAYLDLALFAFNTVTYIINGVWFYSILPVTALLNFAVFFWPELMRLLKIEQKNVRRTVSSRSAAVNRKHEARQANSGERKCAVCGRTNLTNPELDFRYCSRCAGYHCFCSDHIFSHVHFTDDQP